MTPAKPANGNYGRVLMWLVTVLMAGLGAVLSYNFDWDFARAAANEADHDGIRDRVAAINKSKLEYPQLRESEQRILDAIRASEGRTKSRIDEKIGDVQKRIDRITQ